MVCKVKHSISFRPEPTATARRRRWLRVKRSFSSMGYFCQKLGKARPRFSEVGGKWTLPIAEGDHIGIPNGPTFPARPLEWRHSQTWPIDRRWGRLLQPEHVEADCLENNTYQNRGTDGGETGKEKAGAGQPSKRQQSEFPPCRARPAPRNRRTRLGLKTAQSAPGSKGQSIRQFSRSSPCCGSPEFSRIRLQTLPRPEIRAVHPDTPMVLGRWG
jgi:hypothetical protein